MASQSVQAFWLDTLKPFRPTETARRYQIWEARV